MIGDDDETRTLGDDPDATVIRRRPGGETRRGSGSGSGSDDATWVGGFRAPPGSDPGQTMIFGERLDDIPIAFLVILEGPRRGQFHRLLPVTAIGKSRDNDYVIDDDARVSRQHIRIRFREYEGKWAFLLRDLDSTHGTKVNGEELLEKVLEDRDVIRVGKTSMTFLQLEEPDTD